VFNNGVKKSAPTPRVLLFDIETTPNLSYTWGKYEQDVIRFKKEWEILSVAYKWLGESRVQCIGRNSLKNESALVQKLWQLFDEADVVIAHNGASFDDKKSRAKFLEHKLPPPSPYKVIDTKRIAKAQFAFSSNSLNDLGEKLGLGKKVDTGGFDLWLGCMDGKRASWTKMLRYNRQDVVLLERVYLKLRSWAPTHPNLSLHAGLMRACPVCQSTRIQRRGYKYAQASVKAQYQCRTCCHWFARALPKEGRAK